MGGNGNSLGTVDVQCPIQRCGESMGRSMSEEEKRNTGGCPVNGGIGLGRMCLMTGTVKNVSSDSCQGRMPSWVRS
jgi:hypothetical protein